MGYTAAHIFALVSLLWGILHPTLPAGGFPVALSQESTVQFTVTQPAIEFGQRITFQVQIQPAAASDKAFIFLQPDGGEGEFFPLALNADGQAVYVMDTQTRPLRVFTKIHYAFHLESAGGKKNGSPEYTLEYADERFDWKMTADDRFEIFYYDRDLDFAQTALNTAGRGLAEAAKLVPAELTQKLRIYVYRDPRDLQDVQQGLPSWAAGHAAPDQMMVFVAISTGPDQRLELERSLPHEIVHILQYQAYGKPALEFPAWLLEGTASIAEFYQNPEYASALRASAEADRLLPMETLCTGFPRDASGVFLAYAQSQSFTRYLVDRFGASGLTNLYQRYADGMSCTAGFEAAFQTTLSEAEFRWRLEALGINPAALVMRNLLPYLIFFLIVFGAASVTMIFSARRRRAEAAG
jgi:hypothetical protein